MLSANRANATTNAARVAPTTAPPGARVAMQAHTTSAASSSVNAPSSQTYTASERSEPRRSAL